MQKIAFCFLIYDIINQEELWYNFFKNIDKNKYTIYIHYKTQTQLKFFEEYKLKKCIKTNYPDQTIIHAYNVLFKEAFLDPDNYKFVIVSQACIPLKSFNYIYEQLTKDNKGYFNISPQSQCFPNCNSLLRFIEHKYISKSHNWFILNRELVEALAFYDKEKIDLYYNKVYAPAEYFYYTFIKIMNMEDHIITTPNLSADATTFTYWSGTEYKFVDPNNRNLKNYSTITVVEIDYLINSKSLFGRKFNTNCIIIDNSLNFCDYVTSKITK